MTVLDPEQQFLDEQFLNEQSALELDDEPAFAAKMNALRQAARKIATEHDIETGEQSVCQRCGEDIYAVIDPLSLCFDWGSSIKIGADRFMDYGCTDEYNPEWDCDTHGEDCDDEDCDDRYMTAGSHDPGDDHTPVGFKIVHVCTVTPNPTEPNNPEATCSAAPAGSPESAPSSLDAGSA